MKYFKHLIGPEYPISGWKLHIYGENEEEAKKISIAIKKTVLKYKLGGKRALKIFFENTVGKKQEGKAITLYIPASKIKQIREIINELQKDLDTIDHKKDKQISGDKKYSNSI